LGSGRALARFDAGGERGQLNTKRFGPAMRARRIQEAALEGETRTSRASESRADEKEAFTARDDFYAFR